MLVYFGRRFGHRINDLLESKSSGVRMSHEPQDQSRLIVRKRLEKGKIFDNIASEIASEELPTKSLRTSNYYGVATADCFVDLLYGLAEGVKRSTDLSAKEIEGQRLSLNYSHLAKKAALVKR